MMWFLQIALGLLTAWPGGYALSRDDSCVDGDNGTCQELDTSLVQIKTDSPKLRSCEGELLATVAREIKLVQADAPHEEHMQAVFRKGCDPTTSSYSHHCADVKTAHLKTYARLLQRLNEQVHTVGPAAISFGEFATIMLFQCMWRSRHNPGDPYGEKPYDTCTETDLCNMVTTKAGFETFLPQVSLTTLSGIRHAKHGWPGTGKDYSMVRVSLLHKSDGTSSSPETILGRSGLRLSVINGGWAKDATLHLEPKYHEGFQIAWGQIRNGMLPESKLGGPPLRLQSGLAAAEPGQGIRNFSDTGVVAKMPPAAGTPLTMVVIGDPCNGNFLGGGQCILRDYYGVNKTLPVLLNAALPSSDVWYLTGDNFYDRYGVFSVSVFAQLEPAAQGVPVISTPGNHDYWFDGVPGLAFDDGTLGYDQFGNGASQFYAMDTAAAHAPAAPAESLISPPGTPASRFSQAPAFLDFSASPKEDAKAANFQHYSIAGNVGFIVTTCIGEDPRSFVAEACTFMKQKSPALVLFLGHWNKPGCGCPTGFDVPTLAKWALDSSDCSAFRGTAGQSPYGPAKTAATRLKFIVGHEHCNCMTNFNLSLQDRCLGDGADPSEVDGFVIGSHGMSWDPQNKPSCSARFGLPVLRTDGDTLTFAYANLSLDTTLTHCSWYNPFCHARPWEISRGDLYSSFLGWTPSSWSPEVTGPYGRGILTEKMDALIACLTSHGTTECSKNTSLFEQWYTSPLQ